MTFREVGTDDAGEDELASIIGTLKLHTTQTGVGSDGDHVAIGEITSDEDNKIK